MSVNALPDQSMRVSRLDNSYKQVTGLSRQGVPSAVQPGKLLVARFRFVLSGSESSGCRSAHAAIIRDDE